MLFKSHNNLPALHTYLDKVFPWFSSLVLKEGTCLKVVKQGYHPEIAGVMSKDGETMHFEEVSHIIFFPTRKETEKLAWGLCTYYVRPKEQCLNLAAKKYLSYVSWLRMFQLFTVLTGHTMPQIRQIP